MKKKIFQSWCNGILIALFLNSCSISGRFQGPPLPAILSVPETPLVAEVLMRLQLDYAKPEKLNPEKLLQGALSELGRMIPEVRVRFEEKEIETKAELQIFVAQEKSLLATPPLRGLYGLHLTLQKLTKHLLQTDLQITQTDIEKMFVRGILKQLDAYSVLLPREVYREFRINIGGQFAGIGLVVGLREGQLTVIAPMDGSPAARAGVQPLDRIIGVDGQKTEHLTLDEILQRMRGESGTPVRLDVFRKGHFEPLRFELLREEIRLESVETFDLENDNKTVRYVRIKTFQNGTSQELKNKLDGLKSIRGVILDLRNNPGGLLEEAVQVSDLFLERKKRIVSTKGPTVSAVRLSRQLFSSERWQSIPLVVLINHGSASAAEIVAAALRQNQRAIVIGEPSFGKGTIQTLWNLEEGSGLKLTIGEYLTPSGRSIDAVGILPDLQLIAVSVPENKKTSTAFNRFHLLPELKATKTDNKSSEFRLRYLSRAQSEITDQKIKLEKLKADIFVQTAQRVLFRWKPEKIISVVRKVSAQAGQEEATKIMAALARFGIDWSANPHKARFSRLAAPETLELTWSAEENADGTIRLQIQLHNSGNVAARRLLVVTRAANELLDGLEFPIGKLTPQATQTRSLQIKVASGMPEKVEPLEFVLYDQRLEASLTKLKTLRAQLRFAPKRRPSFRLGMEILDNGELDSQGNGDGKIQNGETIALRLKITNNGLRPIAELLLQLREIAGSFGDGPSVRINRGKIRLKNLLPQIEQKDYLLFKIPEKTAKLGKFRLETEDTKSGVPEIIYLWNLQNKLPESPMQTPEFSGLELRDTQGNFVEGETVLPSLILHGSLRNADDLRDVFVHLNGEKVFYSANFAQGSLSFQTSLNLATGKNQISVFARNRHGLTSERRMQILRRK